MSLNIKDPETHQLARELARETGESMTSAVNKALRQRLDEVRKSKRKPTAEELMEIGRRCAALMTPDARKIDVDELLYDEHGLPK